MNISGVVNHYTKVNSQTSAKSIMVSNAVNFQANDTVMIIQMKGATIYTTFPLEGNKERVGETGKYEILLIDYKIGNEIFFKRNILNNYSFSDAVQLVRVKSAINLRITGEVTAPAWNGEIGGIVALIARNDIVFNANIDVSGKGFRGGVAVNRTDACGTSTDFFLPESSTEAGRKGEGFATYYYDGASPVPVGTDFTKGKGRMINAGGGGNGNLAGGAGGSNFGEGGVGGRQVETCSPGDNAYRAHRGQALQTIFNEDPIGTRLYMGGGGGSGTGNLTPDRPGGSGGAAGGLVILLAKRIIGNDNGVLANGQNGLGFAQGATGSGGGGGAGGTVAIHAGEIDDQSFFNVELRGGNGGSNSGPPIRGGGGGGGGGTLLVNRPEIIPFISFISNAGAVGANSNGASGGSPGGSFTDAKFVLNGFLFQFISSDQVVCEGIRPETIIGSIPAAGVTPYAYSWESSNNQVLWNPIPAADGLTDYWPEALTQTTWFRRKVVDNAPLPDGPVEDISLPVKIEVIPKITFNNIFPVPPFTICEGAAPEQFTGSLPEGGAGPGTYSYQWQSKTLTGAWINAPSSSTNRDYTSPPLIDTTDFRRIVFSSVCRDTSTSTIFRINVHPSIQNNSIGSAQTICYDQTPLPFSGSGPPTLIGGNGIYSYLWQRFESGSWNNAPGANTGQNYTFSASLTTVGNNLYRRQVVSGVCTDFSQQDTIKVLSAIAGNALTPVDSLCTGTEIKIGGPIITAGGTGAYSYSWERRFELTSFSPFGATGPTADSIFTGELSQDAYYRRTVTSGPCLHVSNEKAVRIDSRPGSTIITKDTLLFFKKEFDISAAIPTRGIGKWEVVQPTHGYQIVNPNAVNTRITNLNINDVETLHRVIWKVSYLNCADTSGLSIRTRGLFKPNAFSPNDDTLNDYLWFYGLENSESNELTVFNRQGNVVFRARNYQVNPDVDLWNGLDFSGNPVRDDTYYFTLTVNNEVPFQGFIILKR